MAEDTNMKRASNPLSTQSSVLSPDMHSARGAALEALLAVERRRVFADDALDRVHARMRLDTRDRALAHELVYGVLRHRATIDWRLDHVLTGRRERLPPAVTAALRMGAYQILYLDRIPPSAAVNESVQLVKARSQDARQRWPGFVNAVLRGLLRAPAPTWPDPTTDPVTALAVRYSSPAWLAERWLARYGYEQAASLCQSMLTVPPLTIRANTVRVSRDRLMEDLVQAGSVVSPTSVSPVGLSIEKSGPVTDLRQFQEGAFYVEDEAGQLVPPLLEPQPGERVLDACAAPGGKATHLAALMQDRGEVIAMDSSERRLSLLEENCRRLGVTIVKSCIGDLTADSPTSPPPGVTSGSFDAALVDAPCSGLGVLKRHPEAKWNKAPGDLMRHQAKQLSLMSRVGDLLRPGGRLVYSTCSTEAEENEEVIDLFLRNHKEFKREPIGSLVPQAASALLTSHGDLFTLPHMQVMDAFFACRLRKAHR